MKLSDEIALGRMLLKPVPGITNDRHGGGCAFGMANAARGGADFSLETHPWLSVWQNSITLPCDCRAEEIIGGGMEKVLRQLCLCYRTAIIHVFNYHVCLVKDWTLDQLIEWIRQIEPAEEGMPAATVEQGRGVLVAK